MHARAAILSMFVLAACAFVQCSNNVGAPHFEPTGPDFLSDPAAIDEDLWHPSVHVDVGDPPRSIEELRARIEAVMRRDRIAGAGIALVDRNGPIWVGGLGVRDRTTRVPVEGDTAFRVGSLSKSIIALGVMRLVDQGKLDVDRPLREILPDFAIDNPWEAEAPVTLAECLEHTAGFDDMRFNEIFAADEAISVRDTLALNPRSRTIRWKPGTQHRYSNYGYTVAALAIEVASGEPFDAYLRREILAPMGITDADFQRTPAITSRLATGYMAIDEPVVFRPVAHRPAGALLASARDLGKLVHFWLVRGEGYPPIVSATGLARIERSGTLPYPRVDAEYGFANYTDVWSPVIGRGHDGGMPGFHASYRYFPSLGVGYVLAVNSTYSFRGYVQLRELLFSYLTQGRSFAPPAPTAASEPPGARYFQLGRPGNGLFGFIDNLWAGWRVTPIGDGQLVVTGLREDEHWRLIPTADGGYRFPGNSGSSVRFTTSADGKPLMILGWTYTEAGSEWAGRMRLAAFQLATKLLVFAPFWALAELALAFLWRRRIVPRSLILWPLTAGVSCYVMMHLLEHAFWTGVIGTVHPLTVALCGVTILLPIASVATLVSAIRWLGRADRPPLVAVLLPLTFGLVFTGFSLWLAMHGVIGLRTWAW